MSCGAKLTVTPIGAVSLGVQLPVVSMTLPDICIVDQSQPYEGSYEFTPSAEEQTIAISGKKATQDITINPIPQNYGLITWNGSYLTVS